ncbi:hypothetical protein QTP70_033625 [Hemibagrus guttatus]|uniref:Uncharacterized protein n=1 Tax=Hemibagrus guttatus TaxID=175788 RepID=A0AAE0PZZ9_9TELE|nr:hypothetical protein QTP70_033625 [Hemibagrus guttatus]
MRGRHFFLLLCSGVLSFGTFCTALNVGPIDALLDVFVFMDSGLRDVPLLNVSAGVSVNSTALLQDDDVIKMWLQIRLTPLLSTSTISQNFLTCLGYNNFSCQTYQTVVQELSKQFSSLDSQRQQWIYSYFMRPFLSRSAPAGCVLPGGTTEDWITKNFGSFSVLAQLRDFSSINGLFNGVANLGFYSKFFLTYMRPTEGQEDVPTVRIIKLKVLLSGYFPAVSKQMDVLHLLSPEQKAVLMLYPESAGLNNESIGVVLGSLLSSLTPSGDVNTSVGTMWDAGYPVIYSSSPQDPLTQTVNGLMTAFNPVGSFVREFVSFTHQQDLSSMRSATLIQAMLNWTLAELAAPFKNTSNNQQMNQTMFNPTDVNSWFTHVVVPILNRYLSSDIPADLIAVFHNVFYMENSVNKTQDTCSVTLDGACAVANVMEHVAKILQCAARTNLTLTEETVTSLVLHLSSNLNTLLNQLAHTVRSQ